MPRDHGLFTDTENGVDVLTVLLNGELKTATSESHPNFTDILKAIYEDATDDELAPLFDPATEVARIFRDLSDRVSVQGSAVYFDGDPVHNSLTTNILRFLNEGVDEDKWYVLVDYFENVMQNPEAHSREQLYDWLETQQDGVTLSDGGYIVAYKGVYSDGNGGFRSGHAGHAIVNGQDINGMIPYAVGDVVTMPRSEVEHNPGEHCSYGLHVGTYSYARQYGNGTIMKVLVNPRDVVSVAQACKIRVCKFVVTDIVEAEVTTAIDDDADDFSDLNFGSDFE